MTLHDWWGVEEPLLRVGLTAKLVVEFKDSQRCTFWFIRADRIREFKPSRDEATLPR